jgi:phosphate acetyltransferase
MKGRHHQELIERARGLTPIRTAIVHPVDTVSLQGAIEAAKEKLIVPVLVGPESNIRAAAEEARLDNSARLGSCAIALLLARHKAEVTS